MSYCKYFIIPLHIFSLLDYSAFVGAYLTTVLLSEKIYLIIFCSFHIGHYIAFLALLLSCKKKAFSEVAIFSLVIYHWPITYKPRQPIIIFVVARIALYIIFYNKYWYCCTSTLKCKINLYLLHVSMLRITISVSHQDIF